MFQKLKFTILIYNNAISIYIFIIYIIFKLKRICYYKSRKESPKSSTNITYINTNTTYSHKNLIPIRIRTNKYLEKKVIKIKENERLHSKGRGRKYRTKEEKDILHKFNYSYNKELENDEKEEKENLSMNNEDNLNHRIKLNSSGIKFSTEN